MLLLSLKGVVNDVEEKELVNAFVSTWLENLKHVWYTQNIGNWV